MRGPSRVEAKRSAASRQAFTFLELDLHKQTSVCRLSVYNETTTWIVNISPRVKRGMSVCFSFPPPRERKREGRTRRDARARARLLSIRNGVLPPSRNSPAAKRCSPLRQRDWVFAWSSPSPFTLSVSRLFIKRRHDATSVFVAARNDHNPRRWSSSS